MLGAHGLSAAVMARVEPATTQHIQHNCAVCPYARTCRLHVSMGVAETYAPQHCRNIGIIQQDQHLHAEVLTIPRALRHRRRYLATLPVGAGAK